jgi:gamma-glutamyltranspeptidase / glutathione hydrolase
MVGSRIATIILLSFSITTGTGCSTWASLPKASSIYSKQGMVASAHPLASQAGREILKKGGNAVDAAVATTLAISVVEPFSAGIGGGGFLLLHQANDPKIKALDFREKAPAKASQNMYLDAQGKVRPKASVDGYLAVATPGTIAGLAEVHQRHGKLSWSTLVQPAITLAEQGFPVSNRLVLMTTYRLGMLAKNPAAKAIFTWNGIMKKPGDLLVQKDLGKTLRAIAQNPNEFYTGAVGKAIAQDMSRNGGLVSLDDLKSYKPTWRDPVCGVFKQFEICSMPPPSSGGVHLLQLLNFWQKANLDRKPRFSPDVLHFMAESMKIAYADRAVHLGDPAFTNIPTSSLISPLYAAQRFPEISLTQAKPATQVKAASPEFLKQLQNNPESTETSHLTVVDTQRNAVSLTFTINLGFGAGIVAAGTGIVLNNEMDDFAIAPNTPNAFGLVGEKANAIAPGKIPLSSMTPTIVREQSQFKLALGSPGGSTIITTVFQTLINTLVTKMGAGQALSAPKVHHQWLPDQLRIEQQSLSSTTLEDLKKRGQSIAEQSPWGNANLILMRPDKTLEGAADPRGEGAALGY